MRYDLLADIAVLAHLLFVVFVVGGGVAAVRWRWLAWVHLPAAAWGVVVELGGWGCPLTRLENYWRRRGGAAGYSETFIAHYLEPVLYPLGLTRPSQVILGLAALLVNLVIYQHLWRHRQGR